MSARTRTRLGVVIAATLGAAVPFGALHAEPTLQELLDRIEQQDQAIKVLQRKLEIQDETTQTAAKSTPAGQGQRERLLVRLGRRREPDQAARRAAGRFPVAAQR